MIICSASRRYLLLAGTIGTLAVAGWPAAAQQTPASPEAPPPWAQGRPETAIGAKLAPIAPPPIPTAADKLPVAKLKVPKGFKIEVYAAGSRMRARCGKATRARCSSAAASSTRSMPSSTRTASARSRRSTPGCIGRTASPSTTARSTSPSSRKISKVEKIEDNLDNPPKPVVIYDDLPKDEPHGWKFLDRRARQQALFQCRRAVQHLHAARRPTRRSAASTSTAAARRSWRGASARVVGMDWHPVLRQLYFTENQPRLAVGGHTRRQAQSARPARQGQFRLSRIATRATFRIRNSAGAARCDEFTKPIALLGPHSAPLGMRFYTGQHVPVANTATRSSSRATAPGIGPRRSAATSSWRQLNKDGTVKSVEPFITGFIENNNYVGRPADVESLKDGSMLISDDFNGAVYRVTYDSASVGR